MTGWLRQDGIRRCIALVRKESRQMLRDRSTLTLGVVMPVVLLMLFGFGVSLDVLDVPVTVVRDDSSPMTRDLYMKLKFSRYFSPVMANSMEEAREDLRFGRTDAIVRRRLGDIAYGREEVQIIVNGRDANKARMMQRYLEGAVRAWAANKPEAPVAVEGGAAVVVAETRVWYNDAMESRFFLVPGVIVVIMTLIGALLTAFVVAREWERGTYEALMATPVKGGEFLTGKLVPYFLLGMTGLGLCLAASRWVFEVPMRGSVFLVVAGSAVYLMVALGIGLFISAKVKSQFLAGQMVIVICFLPTLMLSGFIFDLNSTPRFVYYLAHVFPSTWYVNLLQTLFLVGDVWSIVVRDLAVLCFFAAAMLVLAKVSMRKLLE